ncbi:CHRD domain-containing protein [Luteitalea sp.]|jgi:hypothetical protein|uniref:CHRD domain-containing protein n=1 Tax=Luteitalea sp. TaxID=2004800 RepID=UPI0037CC9D4F
MRLLSLSLPRALGAATIALTTLAASAPTEAAPITMTGKFQAEAVGATGDGSVRYEYDSTLKTLSIAARFSGLSGLTTVAHIHCCTALPLTGTAGVATQVPTFVGFPTNVTSGKFKTTLNLADASSWNAAFITSSGGTTAAAETRLLNNLESGQAYFNIHTSTFRGGEIRAFVPEPGTMALLGTALAGLLVRRRRS